MLVNLEEKKDILKSDISYRVNQIVEQVNEGNVSALDTFVQLKAINDICDSTMKSIQTSAINEFSQHGLKAVGILGVDTSVVSSTRPTLNYGMDKEYTELSNKLKDRKELLDTAFNYYQKGNEFVLDGEIVPVVDVKGYTAEYIKCTFKK